MTVRTPLKKKEAVMSTLDRCPGNELNKSVSILSCTCDACGKENEVYADELNKKNKCSSCGAILDTSKITTV